MFSVASSTYYLLLLIFSISFLAGIQFQKSTQISAGSTVQQLSLKYKENNLFFNTFSYQKTCQGRLFQCFERGQAFFYTEIQGFGTETAYIPQESLVDSAMVQDCASPKQFFNVWRDSSKITRISNITEAMQVQQLDKSLNDVSAFYCQDITPRDREQTQWQNTIKTAAAGKYGCSVEDLNDYYCFSTPNNVWVFSPFQYLFVKTGDFNSYLSRLKCPESIMYSQYTPGPKDPQITGKEPIYQVLDQSETLQTTSLEKRASWTTFYCQKMKNP